MNVRVRDMMGETAFRIKILCVISRVFRELRAKKGSLVAGLFSGQEANLLALESDNQERKKIEGKNGRKRAGKTVWVVFGQFVGQEISEEKNSVKSGYKSSANRTQKSALIFCISSGNEVFLHDENLLPKTEKPNFFGK